MSGREIKKQKLFFGNGEWCGKHLLSKGNGRATNKPIGSLGKMPTMVGTALGTKKSNPINLRKYKRDRSNHEQGEGRGRSDKR